MTVVSTLCFLLPILLAFAPLLCGRYPGERVLARAAFRAKGWKRTRTGWHRPRLPVRLASPRGGRLIASSAGGRAPPIRCPLCN